MLVLIFLLSLTTVSATFYQYNKQITITDSDSSYMGYVEPYEISSVLGDYAYLKWQRQGFPEGNSWPIYLVEGTTTTLPFGIEGEVLRVKINSVTISGVDLDIDESDILTEIEQIPETMPENVEALAEEAEEQINKIIEDLMPRVEKAVNRGYHSSLHILGSTASSVEKSVSQSIMAEEVKFARRVSDRVISLLLDALIGGLPVADITYSEAVALVPISVRNDLTKFFYNIDSTTDYGRSQSSLASDGGFTLYFGNPNQNKISASFNNRLKSMNLPYFSNGQIIGKRIYKEDSIGMIAAIPEENTWTESTLENRWTRDKIRLYETLIAGIGDDGIKAAGQWYENMLSQSSSLFASFSSLTEGEFDTDDVFDVISDNVAINPKSSISGFALLQGWILSGLESLQNPDFTKADSLGYVVIVKKDGSSYEVLETHTLVGTKKNYFLDPYEFVEQVVEIAQEIEEAAEAVQEPIAAVVAISEPAPKPAQPKSTEKSEKRHSQQKITGQTVQPTKTEEQSEQEAKPKKQGLLTRVNNWLHNFWKGLFG